MSRKEKKDLCGENKCSVTLVSEMTTGDIRIGRNWKYKSVESLLAISQVVNMNTSTYYILAFCVCWFSVVCLFACFFVYLLILAHTWRSHYYFIIS